MSGFDEVVKSLPPYAQFAISVVVLAIGVLSALRGFQDRKKPEMAAHLEEGDPRFIPMWLMMGPAHDVIIEIHRMGEQSRQNNAMMTEICKSMDEMNKGNVHTHRLLENILRNQELMGGPSATLSPRRE